MKAYPILLLDKDLTGEEVHKQLKMYTVRLKGNDSFIFVEHRPKFRAWIISENAPIRIYKTFFLDMIKKAIAITFGEEKTFPTMASLKGIAPNITGDLSSEEYVRKMRDGYPSGYEGVIPEDCKDMIPCEKS